MESFPGIQGVSFSLITPTTKQNKHTATSSKKASPHTPAFLIGNKKSPPQSSTSSHSQRNRRTFGYDMYSDPVRRAAMEQARDNNKAVITGKTKLIQENSKSAQADFLMYLPIYKNGAPYVTLAERRADLVGWVFALFRMDDLIRGILSTSIPDIDIKIYDDEEMSSKTLMHATDNTNKNDIKRDSLFHASKRLEIAGHTSLKNLQYLSIAIQCWTKIGYGFALFIKALFTVLSVLVGGS